MVRVVLPTGRSLLDPKSISTRAFAGSLPPGMLALNDTAFPLGLQEPDPSLTGPPSVVPLPPFPPLPPMPPVPPAPPLPAPPPPLPPAPLLPAPPPVPPAPTVLEPAAPPAEELSPAV